MIFFVEGAVLSEMAQLNIGDEKPVEVKIKPSGSYAMTGTRGKGYSPTSER